MAISKVWMSSQSAVVVFEIEEFEIGFAYLRLALWRLG